MSQDFAIRAHGLGKSYQRGLGISRHDSLREVIRDGVGSLFGQGKERSAPDTFWALQDASFDVRRGENVGIIGLNGAGKSTLLKVLSRITTPTTGSARIAGRLGALLEVGTGFHQELTGRENAFLYGAILGMHRSEVARKFDAIVDFAGIEEFIDTPVKRYSSGMYVRLAFAVAAHLEPDILLLDEVLAVGDYTFQRKCMDFAHKLEQKGATILFVSHNMFSIKSMCQRVIYLKRGRIVLDGPTDEGLKLYESDCKLASVPWFHDDPATRDVVVTDVTLHGEDGAEKSLFEFGERMTIRARFKAVRPVKSPNFLFSIVRSDEVLCCNFSTNTDGIEVPGSVGEGEIVLRTPPLNLVSEMYTLSIVVREGFENILNAQAGATFHMRHPLFDVNGFGVFHEPGEWSVEPGSRPAS